jgi:ribosomal-protein-alanine N-acetyltransferase
MKDVVIRFMELADIDAVCEVEVQSFSMPWSRAAFEAELTENDLANYLVVTVDGKVVGYAGFWLILDEAHVTNIAIMPDNRDGGLGKQLLTVLMELAKTIGAGSMTLEVRVSNSAAQHLYTQLGFVPKGRRRGYYTDTQEDALIMWRESLE